MKRKPFFDDKQIKRLLIQLMASFAGYQVKTGNQRDGKPRYIDVPVIHADYDQTSAYILSGGSTNNIQSLPVISLYISSMEQKSEWRQSPQHIEAYSFMDIARDAEGNKLDIPGARKIIERFMPVPYNVEVDFSMWASNRDQLYQLVEQIATVYNPSQDLLLSNSPADWTFLTTLNFKGNIDFEKVVPDGTTPDAFHTARMGFNTTLWLSPPVRVYDAKLIHEVHIPFKDLEGIDFDAMEDLDKLVIKASDGDLLTFESFEVNSKNT